MKQKRLLIDSQRQKEADAVQYISAKEVEMVYVAREYNRPL